MGGRFVAESSTTHRTFRPAQHRVLLPLHPGMRIVPFNIRRHHVPTHTALGGIVRTVGMLTMVTMVTMVVFTLAFASFLRRAVDMVIVVVQRYPAVIR